MSNSSSSSREYSPDWLRNVQAPPIFTLSSSSSSSSSSSDDDDQLPISSVINNNKSSPPKTTTITKSAGSNVLLIDTKVDLKKKKKEPKASLFTLPSDSDFNFQHPYPKDDDEASSLKLPSKFNSSLPSTHNTLLTKQENEDDLKDLQTDTTTTTDKHTGPYISSSRLPLLLADKVQRSKVLVECEGESIDLSGDLGSVGRVVISDSPSGNQDMLLDLKGTIYKTAIIPSRTFCVVSFGQSEAKIEAIMNDFIQLKPQSNVYEAETMVEGTLEGFSFDSEDEGDKHTIRQTDENEDADPQTNRKGRGKSEKTSDAAKKKGKTAVKKPAAAAKKVKKKAPVAKKTKTKK